MGIGLLRRHYKPAVKKVEPAPPPPPVEVPTPVVEVVQKKTKKKAG